MHRAERTTAHKRLPSYVPKRLKWKRYALLKPLSRIKHELFSYTVCLAGETNLFLSENLQLIIILIPCVCVKGATRSLIDQEIRI